MYLCLSMGSASVQGFQSKLCCLLQWQKCQLLGPWVNVSSEKNRNPTTSDQQVIALKLIIQEVANSIDTTDRRCSLENRKRDTRQSHFENHIYEFVVLNWNGLKRLPSHYCYQFISSNPWFVDAVTGLFSPLTSSTSSRFTAIWRETLLTPSRVLQSSRPRIFKPPPPLLLG